METIASLPALPELPVIGRDAGLPPMIGRDAEADWSRRIEAGVLADAILVGHHPRPAGATDAELAALVRDGETARRRAADANERLVWYVVHPVALRTGLDRDELFQEGMVGLLEAIQRFDPGIASFATCALPRIRMRVWDAAATVHGTIGLPPRRARQWRRARSIRANLAMTLARTPRLHEVAEAVGESPATTASLLAFRPACALPDEPAEEWAAPTASEIAEDVGALLRRLNEDDRAVIAHLFGIDGAPALSYAGAARALGRSESTIRRRERIALGLLRGGAEVLAA